MKEGDAGKICLAVRIERLSPSKISVQTIPRDDKLKRDYDVGDVGFSRAVGYACGLAIVKRSSVQDATGRLSELECKALVTAVEVEGKYRGMSESEFLTKHLN